MWWSCGEHFDGAVGDYIGFVYLIENLDTGRKYVGKKRFKFSRAKKVRGRKRRKRVHFKSDWETYWGSNRELLKDVRKLGEGRFRRSILHMCRTRGEMTWLELKEQVERDVLRKPGEYYNSFVGGKIHRSHLPEEG